MSVKRILVIDDDPTVRLFMKRALEEEGYQIRDLESASGLRAAIEDFHPHLIVCDILMPGQDGLSVCRALRADPQTCALQVVLVSAKDFEEDQRAALDAGAAAYLVKPFARDDLVGMVEAVLPETMTIEIWGCRGSIPAPEKAQGVYGGNTSCISVTVPAGRLIFDAGTGIRSLGNALVSSESRQFHICLTHYHWDHIQGLPFFKPLYGPRNEVIIYGPAHSDETLAEIIAGQMGRDYFPVSIQSLESSMRYVALGEQTFEVLGVSLAAFYVFHPGRTVAYRIEVGDRSVVYAPDNELPIETVEPELSGEALRFARFAQGASLLIHDCTYSRPLYGERRGWGHSCGFALAQVAAHARAEHVLLFHHDPDHNDDEVEAIHREFRDGLEGVDITSEPAAEGGVYRL